MVSEEGFFLLVYMDQGSFPIGHPFEYSSRRLICGWGNMSWVDVD